MATARPCSHGGPVLSSAIEQSSVNDSVCLYVAQDIGMLFDVNVESYTGVQTMKAIRRIPSDFNRWQSDALRRFTLILGKLSQLPSFSEGKKKIKGKGSARKQYSSKLRARVLERDGFKCRRCGHGPPDVRLVLDHVIPVAAGGPSTFENLQSLCEPCNEGKAASSPTPHDLIIKTDTRL